MTSSITQSSARTASKIAESLSETDERPLSQIQALVDAMGEDAILALLAEVDAVEDRGGMLLPDGRRRTRGGVFFYLARRRIPEEHRERIFPHQVVPKSKRVPLDRPPPSSRPRIVDVKELLRAAPPSPVRAAPASPVRAVPERPEEPKASAEPRASVSARDFVLALPPTLPAYKVVSLARDAGFRIEAQYVQAIRRGGDEPPAPVSVRQPEREPAAAPTPTTKKDFVIAHAHLPVPEILEVAAKHGIELTRSHAYVILGRAGIKPVKPGGGPVPAVAVAEEPAAVPARAKLVGTARIALDAIRAVLGQLKQPDRRAVVATLVAEELRED
jgi:hypothetical protein